jgi:hypothetical protein
VWVSWLIKNQCRQASASICGEKQLQAGQIILALTYYLSFRAKRCRIIYRVKEDSKKIEIQYIGRRKNIYEIFGEQLRELKERT